MGYSLITGFEFLFFLCDFIMVPWNLKESDENQNEMDSVTEVDVQQTIQNENAADV